MSEGPDFGRLLMQRMQPYCDLTSGQVSLLKRHYDLLCRWNKAMSLTTVTEVTAAVERHYCESLFAALHLPDGVAVVGDVGSGAGFPGYPMAVVRPELHFILLEAQQKKAAFLREASDGLPNVQVRAVRSEQWNERVDVLVSRAVRPEDVLGMLPKNASQAVLMVGTEDLEKISKQEWLSCGEPIELPWGERRCLLPLRVVPRGTLG